MSEAKIVSIVRCEAMGISTLARQFERYVGFHRVLSICRAATKYYYPHWYANGRFVKGHIPSPDDLVWLLEDADVLLVIENPHSPIVTAMAKQKGIKVVLVPMYECTPLAADWLEHIDHVLAPSALAEEQMRATPSLERAEIEHVPMPFDTERIAFKQRDRAEVFLHHMGRGGHRGRNSTAELIDAFLLVQSDARLIVTHQSPLPDVHLPDGVTAMHTDPVEDYWDIWRAVDADVYVRPHKWDGLSLPVLEAMCAGMPVMTTRAWPFCDADGRQGWMPEVLQGIAIEPSGTFTQTISRPFRAHHVEPYCIAEAMDRLYGADIRELSLICRAYAEQHSWSVMADAYRDRIVA